MHNHSTVTGSIFPCTSTSQFAMSSKWTISDHNHVDFFFFPVQMFAFVHHLRAAHKLKKREKNHHAINVARTNCFLLVYFLTYLHASQQTMRVYCAAAVASGGGAAGFFVAVVDDFQYTFRSSLRDSHTQRVLNCRRYENNSFNFSSLIWKHLHQKRNIIVIFWTAIKSGKKKLSHRVIFVWQVEKVFFCVFSF